jgi:hypothetical protein
MPPKASPVPASPWELILATTWFEVAVSVRVKSKPPALVAPLTLPEKFLCNSNPLAPVVFVISNCELGELVPIPTFSLLSIVIAVLVALSSM